MKKIFPPLILLLLFTFLAQAEDILISGRILSSETGEGVERANVRLLLRADSTFVDGGSTNIVGTFNAFVSNNREYIVHVSFVGYQDVYKDIDVRIPARGLPQVVLEPIHLVVDTALLDAVEVTAQLPRIIMRGDTLEFTTDGIRLPEGARVEELLRQLPGVEIDEDGNVTVNGQRVSRMFLDGEPFITDDPASTSRILPARMVDRVQVMRRMTEVAQMTGFGSGAEETVINLTTRPGMNQGIIGDATGGYGSQERYEARATLNYMRAANRYAFFAGANNTNTPALPVRDVTGGGTIMMGGGIPMGMGGFGFGQGGGGITTSRGLGGGFNLNSLNQLRINGGATYGHNNRHVETSTWTQNLLSAGNTLEQEYSRSNNIGENLNMNLRFDWRSADEMTRIMFTPTASISNNINTRSGEFSTIREATGDSINYGDSRSSFEERRNQLGSNLHISRTIGRPGRVVSALLNANLNNSEGTGSNWSETNFLGVRPDTLIDQRVKETGNSRSWRGFFSFVEPIGDNSFLQLAYTYSQNLSNSDRNTHSRDAAGNHTMLDTLFSRRIENRFTDQNVEVNFRHVQNRGLAGSIEYTVGMSVRPSSSHSRTFRADSLIDNQRQRVVNYAPVAQLILRRGTMGLGNMRMIRLHYTGETRQPTVQQLSPVVNISNPLNIFYGNPDLKPSFTHRVNVLYNTTVRRGSRNQTEESDDVLPPGMPPIVSPRQMITLNFSGTVRYLTNDVVSSSFIDVETGRRESTFENVSGNWNTDGNIMLHIPLRGFTFVSMSRVMYSHTNGLLNRETNLSRQTNFMQMLQLSRRFEAINFSINGSVNSNRARNSLDEQLNRHFYTYRAGAEIQAFLPWDLSLRSDISYFTNSGYADGFQVSEWMWNASIEKANLFRNNRGALRFTMYDILQQQTNISRMVTANFIRDTRSNTLTSYFMAHFTYRFDVFRGDVNRWDMIRRDE